MGWIAFTKDGQRIEEDGMTGRPVQAGEEGKLAVIAQEDFGHKVAVDLYNGVIALEYDDIGFFENSTQLFLHNTKAFLVICDETTIVGELANLEESLYIEKDSFGKEWEYKNDVLTPLIWRPIWFTRVTNGIPAKVIGAQTTMPPQFGGHNVKKLVTLFSDGRVGIS